ncbi:MAG: ATP-binding cassette domain-containing protein [Anaerolineales bacterium]|nr:ATP-binding cassette domain-containing protein [Anaerolineales bacterium]
MGLHSGNWWSYIRYDEEQDRPEVSKDLLRRVWIYARPYWKGITLILITIFGISLLNLIPPLLIRDLIDNAIPEEDVTRITLLAVGMIAIPFIAGLFGVGQRYMSAAIGEGIIFDLRSELYAHLQGMSLRFFTNTQVGEVMSRLNNDVIGAQRAVTGTVVTLISNVVTLILTLAIMISLEWRLTLLGIAILPFFVIPARRVGRVLRGLARQSMESNARMNAMMNETLNISGALLSKIFGRHASENKRFRERASEVREIGVRQAVVGRGFFLALSLVGAAGTAFVFWAGGNLVISGLFTIGTIVAFTAYLRDLYGPLMAMTNARVEFSTSMVSFERVFEVLDMPQEIIDGPQAVELESVMGQVRFNDVSFSYLDLHGVPAGLEEVRRFSWHSPALVRPVEKSKEDGDGDIQPEELEMETRWALKDVDFEVLPGEVAALVGPSGAGKTTITYLIPRLYDPTSGMVTLDGKDLRDVKLDSLADHIGMVTQETYLFHDTVRNNLLYAKPDATQLELENACKAANIHDFIVGLPEGYETVVGERGYRLSGGEKQRVAIARVILNDPQVLILDEATSHLDSESEALIQEAMEVVMQGRTSIVIAHRLSTIIDADQILVMDEGELVEQGRHEELLERGGLYARLYETQFNPAGTPA